jgi:distribution and morphology protein 31
VHWDPEKPYDPRAARREPRHGDFHLTSLELQDLLVTVYQPGDFRPFNYSIFNASVPRLRKQWLFYDLLSADSITGQVDGCLFSLHKPQRMGRTTQSGQEDKNGRWQTLVSADSTCFGTAADDISQSRVRIDGVSFDHIQNQSDLHGPISWITSGKFDSKPCRCCALGLLAHVFSQSWPISSSRATIATTSTSTRSSPRSSRT